jgi:hypothetical protein
MAGAHAGIGGRSPALPTWLLTDIIIMTLRKPPPRHVPVVYGGECDDAVSGSDITTGMELMFGRNDTGLLKSDARCFSEPARFPC